TASVPEVTVALTVNAPTLTAQGQIGFLKLGVSPTPGYPAVRFLGAFSVDLTDPSDDGKLTWAELTGGNFELGDFVHPQLSADVDMHLHLLADLGSDQFPSLGSDFTLHWEFNNADPNDSLAGDAPQVAFTNVYLDLGTFVSHFVGPILSKIQGLVQPLQPIIDVLARPLPVLSDLGGQSTTLLDLAQSLGISDTTFLQTAVRIIYLATHLPANADNVRIPFGAFDLGSTDVRAESDLSDVTPTITDAKDPEEEIEHLEDSPDPDTAANARFVKGLSTIPGGGFQLTILKNPSSLMGLFMGKDATLFTYDLPTLKLHFDYDQFFPIIGPLGAHIEGTLDASAHFAVAYDTTGIREFFNDHFDPAKLIDLLDGVFIVNPSNPDGTPVPQVALTGELDAGAELNLVGAKA